MEKTMTPEEREAAVREDLARTVGEVAKNVEAYEAQLRASGLDDAAIETWWRAIEASLSDTERCRPS